MTLFSDPESSTDDLKLLAIGDVHLGTRPSSLPEGLSDLGVDPRALTPEAALLAAVDSAVEERVDAVLFAGDVVEDTNARFEALRPLEQAVRRLLAANIPVLGVVGNHDVEALPRLAGMIEGLELLGERGRWQSRVIDKDGRPALEVLGWSFPEKHVRSSPVADLLRKPMAPVHPGIPRIGLLHGDLDASGGSYAPFTRRELADAGLDAWLLGHIHKPSLSGAAGTGERGPCGYLGSLVGLDPGETGQRGPWLVRVTKAGQIETRQLANAPLRWEHLDVRVAQDEEAEDVGDRLLEEAERFARQIQTRGIAPQALGLRLRLVGATRNYDALRNFAKGGRWKGGTRRAGETLVFIDKVLDGLDLALDLEELARGDDPPALLARKLLILEQPGEPRRELLEAARSKLQDLAREPRWSVLDEQRDSADPLCEDALASLLKKSGTAVLSELLAQRVPDAETRS
ncbi:MAG: DNA repair exonuclease [bacterium]|nr:DNA repair exonuclease [bacterium]